MTERKRIGLIRVLTTEDRDLLQAHGRLLEAYFPAMAAESRCIPDQYEGVHDAATEASAIPKVVDMGHSFAEEGYDGVYVSCAGDPGVRILQRELSIPVVGAGIASAYVAKSLGQPVGILSITDNAPGETASILGDLLVGSTRPEKVHTTLDLLRPEAMEEFVDGGRRLCAKGARVLLLGCTGLATINAAPVLRCRLGVPVIDPIRAAAATLWAALC